MNHKLYANPAAPPHFAHHAGQKSPPSRADTDSVAASLTSGYFLRIDTAMRRISFDFDTLDIYNRATRRRRSTIGSVARENRQNPRAVGA